MKVTTLEMEKYSYREMTIKVTVMPEDCEAIYPASSQI